MSTVAFDYAFPAFPFTAEATPFAAPGMQLSPAGAETIPAGHAKHDAAPLGAYVPIGHGVQRGLYVDQSMQHL